MAAAFDHPAAVDDEDLVGVANGAQPVSDDDGRAAAEQHPHGALDALLALRVHAAGGLVQDEDARVGEQRPGEADQLPLSGREA